MLGLFDYEYGDEGISTLADKVDFYNGGFYCSKCQETLLSNETHDCIECAHCGESNSCICNEQGVLNEY